MKFDLPRGQHHRHVRIALIAQVAGFEGHLGMGRQQGVQRRHHQFDMFQPSLVAATRFGRRQLDAGHDAVGVGHRLMQAVGGDGPSADHPLHQQVTMACQ